eukprot:COSAG01_NODE_146_length_24099_cov_25.341208_20_plen_70_part_00
MGVMNAYSGPCAYPEPVRSDGSGTCDGGWHIHVPVPSAPVRSGITLSAVPPEATGVGRGLLRQQLQLAL